MKPTHEDVILAYRLFLGRIPSTMESTRMFQNVESVDMLRRIFLNSPEFSRNAIRIKDVETPLRERTLIHIHIPKTAGTTLNSLLGDKFTFQKKETAGDNTLDRIRLMPAARKRQLGFLFGHMSHGVHRLLIQDYMYLCVLRKPGERLLSYYNYIINRVNHPLHVVATQIGSFGEFLDHVAANPNIRPEFDNGQIRRVAGDMTTAGLGQEKALLRQGLSNIFRDDCIYGLTERFDDFQKHLVTQGILPSVISLRKNSAPQLANLEAELDQLTPRHRSLYDNFVYWDNRFYEICRDFS